MNYSETGDVIVKIHNEMKQSYKVVQLSTELICPNRMQPRKRFDNNQMIRLADSIRRYGILQPLCVRLSCSVDPGKNTGRCEANKCSDYDPPEKISLEDLNFENEYFPDEMVRIYSKGSISKIGAKEESCSNEKTAIYDFSDVYIPKNKSKTAQTGSIFSSSKQYYELVSGERRLRAAKILGMPTVPCIILEADDSESAEMAIIENLQRENLDVFEEAEAYRRLIRNFGFTQDKIARKMGVSQSSVANKIRLLQLCDDEREEILENGLTERHARALLRIKEENLRREALSHIIAYRLNVNSAERYIDRLMGCSRLSSVIVASLARGGGEYSALFPAGAPGDAPQCEFIAENMGSEGCKIGQTPVEQSEELAPEVKTVCFYESEAVYPDVSGDGEATYPDASDDGKAAYPDASGESEELEKTRQTADNEPKNKFQCAVSAESYKETPGVPCYLPDKASCFTFSADPSDKAADHVLANVKKPQACSEGGHELKASGGRPDAYYKRCMEKPFVSFMKGIRAIVAKAEASGLSVSLNMSEDKSGIVVKLSVKKS